MVSSLVNPEERFQGSGISAASLGDDLKGHSSQKRSSLAMQEMSLLMLARKRRRYLNRENTQWLRRPSVLIKKSVKFTSLATVHIRPEISSEDTWYSREDYARFERERRETIAVIRSVNGGILSLDPNVHCVHGLEHQLSKKQVLSRKYNSMQYTRALLEEQFVQKMSGYRNPQSLQMLSRMFSEKACDRAHFRAVLVLSNDT